MIQSGGLWFPDGDEHFEQFGDKVVHYQRKGRDVALSYVKRREIALDIGAHVGIFSKHFSVKFKKVFAFEPIEENRECLRLNVPANVEIMPYAVGDVNESRRMQKITHNSGGSFISNDKNVDLPPIKLRAERNRDVEMITIDSLDLPDVGLIKLDVQGSELIALRGAEKTIRKYRPVILIEEKAIGGVPGADAHIRRSAEYLVHLGAQPKERVGADRVYVME